MALVMAGAVKDGSSAVPTPVRRSSRSKQLTSVCYTFVAIAEVNMEVHALHGLRRSAGHASPRSVQIGKKVCLRRGMVAATCFFYFSELDQRVNETVRSVSIIYGQEGLLGIGQ